MTELLRIENLEKFFRVKTTGFFGRKATLKAVDGVSLVIKKGQNVGLVGESGCGKSTLGQTAIYLQRPTGGEVALKGRVLGECSQNELREMRKMMQMIFQDPFSSLNPRMTVKEILAEPFVIHNICTGKRLEREVSRLLDVVGLDAAYSSRFPHEFSGGQRQRIGIARSIALNPELIVADEPVSALDVSIQAQILNLLSKLHRDMGLTFLFVAHDLAVVEHVSDWVAVMYLGKIVEQGPAEDVFVSPRHPYTRALTASVPLANSRDKTFAVKGDVPSPLNPPSGCHYHPRCPLATDKCKRVPPLLEDKGSSQHKVACHHV